MSGGQEEVNVSIKTSLHLSNIQGEVIQTEKGPLQVFVKGDRTLPAIITYHDVGLNHDTCFGGFFNYESNIKIVEMFCIYQIDAPGQSPTDATWDGEYLTMEELSDQIEDVAKYYNIKRFVGLGVGVGAYLFLQYAVKYKRSRRLQGLMLVSPVASAASWYEWGYYNSGIMHVQSNGGKMTNYFCDLLLNKYFSAYSLRNLSDLVDSFKSIITNEGNAQNMAQLLKSYTNRKDILKDIETLDFQILLISGHECSVIAQVEEVYSSLPTGTTSFVKTPFCGCLAHEEKPGAFGKAILYYLSSLRISSSITNALLKLAQEFPED